jgi:hypothetical protein
MARRHFRAGEPVIYCKSKHSVHPGPRARDVQPSEHGDIYTYTVDKFWTVLDEGEDGTVVLVTRTGKSHRLPSDDPNLRRPRLWERLWYRARFPRLCQSPEAKETH